MQYTFLYNRNNTLLVQSTFHQPVEHNCSFRLGHFSLDLLNNNVKKVEYNILGV